MATITTRNGKGSPLTSTELDANFTNLNTDKADKAQVLTDVPADAVFTDTLPDSASQLLTKLKTVDGIGSGLNAELLDGNEASAFLTPTGDGSQLTGLPSTGANAEQVIAIEANTLKVTNSDQSKSDIEALGIAASSITGPLPAIDGSALTGVSAGTLNGYTISVVAEVPSSPVANTIYLVEA